jgi:hypothetical protein
MAGLYTRSADQERLAENAMHLLASRAGVVQGFTGDGIMATFGVPTAFEDAPLRACRASLSIVQSLKLAGADRSVELSKNGADLCLEIGVPCIEIDMVSKAGCGAASASFGRMNDGRLLVFLQALPQVT